MTVALLDVNVLLALSWDSHPHFETARTWFQHSKPRWATCPLTELGFLRLSSNQKIIPRAGTARMARQGLDVLHKQPRHEFWPDDFSPGDEPLFERLQGHNQITDAYLLTLSKRRKGVLATFDAGVQTLAREVGDEKHVLLIPV